MPRYIPAPLLRPVQPTGNVATLDTLLIMGHLIMRHLIARHLSMQCTLAYHQTAVCTIAGHSTHVYKLPGPPCLSRTWFCDNKLTDQLVQHACNTIMHMLHDLLTQACWSGSCACFKVQQRSHMAACLPCSPVTVHWYRQPAGSCHQAPPLQVQSS